MVDELAEDLDDLHEVRLHLVMLPLAGENCDEPQSVLLGKWRELLIQLGDVLE